MYITNFDFLVLYRHIIICILVYFTIFSTFTNEDPLLLTFHCMSLIPDNKKTNSEYIELLKFWDIHSRKLIFKEILLYFI